jgi:hypothetical protein
VERLSALHPFPPLVDGNTAVVDKSPTRMHEEAKFGSTSHTHDDHHPDLEEL